MIRRPVIAAALSLLALSLSACSKHESAETEEEARHEQRKVVVTSPVIKDVVSTRPYVCQIHSRRHIEIRALESGYLEEIPVKEGQAVKQGELLFQIVPTLYQAKLDSEAAEVQLAQIEFNNTLKLFNDRVVSDKEVALAKAKLARAVAKMELAQAERNFTSVKAPFDGIIDRLHEQHGSLVEERDILTTLSDNSVMWVYFNVREALYLEYKAEMDRDPTQADLQLELVLANGNKFPEPGKISAIEADFNNRTGNIAFRADFSNPTGLLRHGQTGTILIHRKLHNSLVIPQRSTYEILAKRYCYVVDEDNVVHQRDIEEDTDNPLDDVFVIKNGLDVNDKIVLEGVQQLRDGDKVEYEFSAPDEVLAHLKFQAE